MADQSSLLSDTAPGVVPPFHRGERPASRPKRLLPILVVKKRIVETSLSTIAKLVALLIADTMGPEDGRQVGFISQRTLARWCSCSVRAVRNALKELDQLDPPLFLRRRGGPTRGRPHRCDRFELVEQPAKLLRYRQFRAKRAGASSADAAGNAADPVAPPTETGEQDA